MSLYKTFKIPDVIIRMQEHGDAKKIASNSSVNYAKISMALRVGRCREDSYNAITQFYNHLNISNKK
jgi:hypothetical protein